MSDVYYDERQAFRNSMAKALNERDLAIRQRDQFKYFAEIVSRSACLKQINGDECICFACVARRLLDYV